MSFKPPSRVNGQFLRWAAPRWYPLTWDDQFANVTHGTKVNNLVIDGNTNVSLKYFRQTDSRGAVVQFEFWLSGSGIWYTGNIYQTATGFLIAGCRPSATQMRQYSFCDSTTSPPQNRNAWVYFYNNGQVQWRGLNIQTPSPWAGGQVVDYPVP